MNWNEFESIIDNTSIELYSTEWHELEKAFNKWKENKEEKDYTDDIGYGDLCR